MMTLVERLRTNFGFGAGHFIFDHELQKAADAIEKAEADRERVISRHGGSIVTLGAYTDALARLEQAERLIERQAEVLKAITAWATVMTNTFTPENDKHPALLAALAAVWGRDSLTAEQRAVLDEHEQYEITRNGRSS